MHPSFIVGIDPSIISNQGNTSLRICLADDRIAGRKNSGSARFMVIPQQQGTAETVNRERFAVLLPNQRIFTCLQTFHAASALRRFLRRIFPDCFFHSQIQRSLLDGGASPGRIFPQPDPGASFSPQIPRQHGGSIGQDSSFTAVDGNRSVIQYYVPINRQFPRNSNRLCRLYSCRVTGINHDGSRKCICIESFIRISCIQGVCRRSRNGQADFAQKMSSPLLIKRYAPVFPDRRSSGQPFGNFQFAQKMSFSRHVSRINELVCQFFQYGIHLTLVFFQPVPVGTQREIGPLFRRINGELPRNRSVNDHSSIVDQSIAGVLIDFHGLTAAIFHNFIGKIHNSPGVLIFSALKLGQKISRFPAIHIPLRSVGQIDTRTVQRHSIAHKSALEQGLGGSEGNIYVPLHDM